MKDSEPCPCGSGKPQITCCGSAARSRMNLRLVVMWCLILLAAGGITAITVMLPSQRSPETAVESTPQPYQYDPVANQHWNPDHGHWDPGPPPSGATTAPSLAGAAIGSTSGGQVPAPPNIPNPQPWQYDAATDRHYHPDHAHWHSGPPPADPTAAVSSTPGGQVPAPPNIPNPQPWQYDAATDRHYHPDHGHWHSGSPPADKPSPGG